jgi:hypothetical protein
MPYCGAGDFSRPKAAEAVWGGRRSATDRGRPLSSTADSMKKQGVLRCGCGGMDRASNASLVKSSIDIFIWNFPLKSHFADAGRALSPAIQFTPPRSCATRHTPVDNELRTRHIVGRVGGEEEHPVRNILRRASPAEWHSGLGHLASATANRSAPDSARPLLVIACLTRSCAPRTPG